MTSRDAQIETGIEGGIEGGVINGTMIEMGRVVGILRDQSETQVMHLASAFRMLDGSQPLEVRVERIAWGGEEQKIGYGMLQRQG